MEYHDKVLKCSECGAEFVFTAGEQMFFADKGFKNEPKRCKACKAKRSENSGSGTYQRAETKTTCSQCGKETDRKSTRLNSSHVAISYAVFCLKKKKIKITQALT